MEEQTVKRKKSTKIEICRDMRGVKELRKIVFSQKALVAVVSNAISGLIMIWGQVTHNMYILLWICMYLTLEGAFEKVFNSISIENQKGDENNEQI